MQSNSIQSGQVGWYGNCQFFIVQAILQMDYSQVIAYFCLIGIKVSFERELMGIYSRVQLFIYEFPVLTFGHLWWQNDSMK